MPTIQITEQRFDETVKSGIVFIDWWAPWCGPCRAFAPVYEKLAERHADVVFGKINTEDERRLAAAFNIRAIPTLMVFRDGILLYDRPGMLPAEALEELLQGVRALDMDEVRREIAAQEATAETRTESGTAGEARGDSRE